MQCGCVCPSSCYDCGRLSDPTRHGCVLAAAAVCPVSIVPALDSSTYAPSLCCQQASATERMRPRCHHSFVVACRSRNCLLEPNHNLAQSLDHRNAIATERAPCMQSLLFILDHPNDELAVDPNDFVMSKGPALSAAAAEKVQRGWVAGWRAAACFTIHEGKRGPE